MPDMLPGWRGDVDGVEVVREQPRTQAVYDGRYCSRTAIELAARSRPYRRPYNHMLEPGPALYEFRGQTRMHPRHTEEQ